MTNQEFDELIDESLESIPDEFREHFHNLSVTAQDWPTDEQLAGVGVRRGQGLLFGIYTGLPKTKGGHYTVKLPDRIIVFRVPLLMISKSQDDLRRNIRNTVLHEVGHHFGMNEKQIRDALTDK